MSKKEKKAVADVGLMLYVFGVALNVPMFGLMAVDKISTRQKTSETISYTSIQTAGDSLKQLYFYHGMLTHLYQFNTQKASDSMRARPFVVPQVVASQHSGFVSDKLASFKMYRQNYRIKE